LLLSIERVESRESTAYFGALYLNTLVSFGLLKSFQLFRRAFNSPGFAPRIFSGEISAKK